MSDVSLSREELERLRRIEAAASQVMAIWSSGKRQATPMLRAMAELRAALTTVAPHPG